MLELGQELLKEEDELDLVLRKELEQVLKLELQEELQLLWEQEPRKLLGQEQELGEGESESMTVLDYINNIEDLEIYSSGRKSSIFCFAQLLLQILVNHQHQFQNLLVLRISKHPLEAEFDEDLAE